MSGGHYDYLYSRVEDLCERVECDYAVFKLKFENGEEGYTQERAYALKTLYELLKKSKEGAYLAEWWLSADTDSDKFVEWSKTV